MTSRSLPQAHPKYRPDIDGLRAVAVSLVVVYHAFPECLSGGFIGVDIFFVISGYLISTIIFNHLAQQSFSFVDFYVRRIRRIFPALLTVLGASLLFGAWALLADEYAQLGKHVAAGVGFVSNLVLRREAGYFDPAADTKPLLHLWSLAVEEQFYIVWPLLLWAAWRWRVNLGWLVAAIALASFAANLWAIGADPVGTFYFPHTRFWELLAGSLLAWALGRPQGARGALAQAVSARHALSLLGLAALVYGALCFAPQLRYPDWRAGVPVLGAVALICAGPEALVNRWLLGNRLATAIGAISYPLYLWHWPLLAFARVFNGAPVPAAGRALLVAAALLAAWLTWRLIERPLRFGPHGRGKALLLLGLMGLVGGAGYGVTRAEGFAQRVDARLNRIAQAAGEWQYPGSMAGYPFQDRLFFTLAHGAPATTLFVGDSNIEQYYPRIAALHEAGQGPVNDVIFATRGGCLPIPAAPHDAEHSACKGLMETALALAQQQARITTVVIGGQWNGYLAQAQGAGVSGEMGPGSVQYQAQLAHLGAYIRQLRALGKRVYLVLNIPTGAAFDPKYLVTRSWARFPAVFDERVGGLPRAELAQRYGTVQGDLQAVGEAAGARILRPMDTVCSARFCPALDAAGEPMYKDYTHLRPRYVRAQARFIDATVRPD